MWTEVIQNTNDIRLAEETSGDEEVYSSPQRATSWGYVMSVTAKWR